MNFEFNYSIDDIQKCISDLERELRDVICYIMDSKYGIRWEFHSSLGFEKNKIQDLENRINEEKNKFHNQTISERLLDYCYILDLKEIIEKNWSDFARILPTKDTTMMYITKINEFRNPIFHNRNDILLHQKFLCLGICGELLIYINRWKQGFRHNIKGYICWFQFPAMTKDFNSDKYAKLESRKLSTNWIKKIVKLSPKNPTIVESDSITISNRKDKEILVRLKEGHLKITFPKEYPRYSGYHYWTSEIYISTTSINVINRIMNECQYPYNTIYWLLDDEIDIKKINYQRHLLSSNSLFSDSIDEEQIDFLKLKYQDYIDTNIMTNFMDRFHLINSHEHMFENENIKVIMQKNFRKSKTAIALLFDGYPTKAFFRAHSIFSPDLLISILLGEITIPKIRLMIKNSRSCVIENNENLETK